jgi:uncharacterized protein YuzE
MIGFFVTYDPEADAMYVSFRSVEPGGVRDSLELDESRHVDYDYDDEQVGVEFLNVSDGVNLDGVPRAAEIRTTLERLLATRLSSKSAA